MNRIIPLVGFWLGGLPAWSQTIPLPALISTRTDFPHIFADKEYWEWGGKAGVSPQGFEAGISRCNWRSLPLGMVTVSVLNEFPRGVTWVNPKVSTDIAWFFFAARLSVVDYSNWRRHDMRVRPEYGFSFLGFANVLYHHDLFLSVNQFDIAPEGWSVSFNFPTNPKK